MPGHALGAESAAQAGEGSVLPFVSLHGGFRPSRIELGLDRTHSLLCYIFRTFGVRLRSRLALVVGTVDQSVWRSRAVVGQIRISTAGLSLGHVGQ